MAKQKMTGAKSRELFNLAKKCENQNFAFIQGQVLIDWCFII
jgi:hypothetical protein